MTRPRSQTPRRSDHFFRFASFFCLGSIGLFLGRPCHAQAPPAPGASKGTIWMSVGIRGAVTRPGRLDLPVGTTLTEAIPAVGGLLPLADKGHFVVKHSGSTSGGVSSYELAQQRPADTKVNPVLLDGDTVVVPALVLPVTYTLAGPGVHNPAEYALSEPAISLARAIGRAGGLEDRADVSQVRITRFKPDGSVAVLFLDATDPKVQAKFQVQAGDQIVIGKGKARIKVFASFPPIPQNVASR